MPSQASPAPFRMVTSVREKEPAPSHNSQAGTLSPKIATTVGCGADVVVVVDSEAAASVVGAASCSGTDAVVFSLTDAVSDDELLVVGPVRVETAKEYNEFFLVFLQDIQYRLSLVWISDKDLSINTRQNVEYLEHMECFKLNVAALVPQ